MRTNKIVASSGIAAVLLSSVAFAQADSMAGMDMSGSAAPAAKPAMQDMLTAQIPVLKETGTYTVTGKEDWKQQTGFGHNAPMVGMMNEMMIGGSDMGNMKMGPMKMDFGPSNYTTPQGDTATSDMAGMDMSGDKTPSAPPPTPAPTPNNSMPGMDMSAKTAPSVTPATPAATPKTSMPGMDMSAVDPLTVTAKIGSIPKSGDNKLMITVADKAGKPVTGAKVIATVSMVTMDMGTARPEVFELGAGKYSTTVAFGMSGPWKVQLHVTSDGHKPQTKAFTFDAK